MQSNTIGVWLRWKNFIMDASASCWWGILTHWGKCRTRASVTLLIVRLTVDWSTRLTLQPCPERSHWRKTWVKLTFRTGGGECHVDSTVLAIYTVSDDDIFLPMKTELFEYFVIIKHIKRICPITENAVSTQHSPVLVSSKRNGRHFFPN